MAHSAPTPDIPKAHAGPISNRILRQIMTAGRTAQKEDHISDTDAALMLLCIPQMAKELLDRRNAMRMIGETVAASNVTYLPGSAHDG